MKTNNLDKRKKVEDREERFDRRRLTVIATMPNKRTESYIKPLELICTASPLINALKNQGKARPTRRSKTFDPNVFETPISTRPERTNARDGFSLVRNASFLPCRTTKTLLNASGTLEPAARKVIPMTLSGMPKVKPMIVTIQTIR